MKAWGGRPKGAKTFSRAPCAWYEEYLGENPIYHPSKFRRMFHIPLLLYYSVHDRVVAAEPRFKRRKSAFGKLGHTSDQKILASFRRLEEGKFFEKLDDPSKMGCIGSNIQINWPF